MTKLVYGGDPFKIKVKETSRIHLSLGPDLFRAEIRACVCVSGSSHLSYLVQVVLLIGITMLSFSLVAFWVTLRASLYITLFRIQQRTVLSRNLLGRSSIKDYKVYGTWMHLECRIGQARAGEVLGVCIHTVNMNSYFYGWIIKNKSI